MAGNRKQNEDEGKKRPSRGIPKIPKTGLTFDGQERSTYDFVNNMQIEKERLLGVFTSIVVNGKPSPRELMDAIHIGVISPVEDSGLRTSLTWPSWRMCPPRKRLSQPPRSFMCTS